MSLPPYFATVTSTSSFRRISKKEKAAPLVDLKHSAASNWGRQHLIACRVICHPTRHSVSPFLDQYNVSTESQHPSEIKQLLDGPNSGDLDQSEHYLAHKYGILGQLWAALAIFKGSTARRAFDPNHDSELQDERRPQRERQPTSHMQYVDSAQMRVDSSDPLSQPSQETSSSISYVSAQRHHQLKVSEDATLRLASCLFRYILLHAPPQHFTPLIRVVEFRDVKSRLKAKICGKDVTATDDGGLCVRLQQDGVFQVQNNRLAILEAKSTFGFLNEGVPDISDECFAQMTCQALVARLVDGNQYLEQRKFVDLTTQLNNQDLVDYLKSLSTVQSGNNQNSPESPELPSLRGSGYRQESPIHIQSSPVEEIPDSQETSENFQSSLMEVIDDSQEPRENFQSSPMEVIDDSQEPPESFGSSPPMEEVDDSRDSPENVDSQSMDKPFIHVTATSFLDINTRTGRERILRNMQGLVRMAHSEDA
ncbi:hypothetical protein E4U21_004769 [Claviceps maximensis]|nr:hypothetical protein E4U21_004769 [Claviceps maximensis]